MAPKGGKTGDAFVFEFDPKLASFRVAFEDWSKLLKDWKAAWDDVATLFRRHEARHLNSQGTSTGLKFPELRDRPNGKPGYKTWKEKHYPGLPILQREKVLFRALVEGGPGSTFQKKKKSMKIGIKEGASLSVNGKKYDLYKAALNHATGDTLPQRPPIRFDGNISDRNSFGYALSQILQAHVVRARRKAFKREIEDSIGGPAGAMTGADRTINSVLSREWK